MLYKRNEIWWCKFRVDGEVQRHSTRTRNRAEAEVEAARLRLASCAPRGQGCRLSQLAAADVARAEGEAVTPRHIKELEYCWGHLLSYFGPDFDPALMTYDLAQEFIYVMRKAGFRGQSIRRYTQRHLRHIWGTLADKSDRRAAQDLLGHTTERMTMNYLHSTPSTLAEASRSATAALVGGHKGWAQGYLDKVLLVENKHGDQSVAGVAQLVEHQPSKENLHNDYSNLRPFTDHADRIEPGESNEAEHKAGHNGPGRGR